MKNLKTLTLITMLIGAIALSVNVNATELSKIRSIQLEKVQNIMDRAVDFPQYAREYGITGTVRAKIEISLDGKVIIEGINGHPELRSYVTSQLQKVTLDDISLSGETFIAKFEFRN